MTKFMTLGKPPEKTGEVTVFTRVVTITGAAALQGAFSPMDYDNVLYLGHDIGYGDVFKAWSDNSNTFTLFFGKKGDEFDK